jgi:ribonuclease R
VSKSKKVRDPHFEREAEKYSNPIPSREFIIEYLKEQGTPVSWDKIVEALNLESDEQLDALHRRLRAMERDGQLITNRRGSYGLIDKMNLIRGRVVGHRDGYGFVIPDEEGGDLFLSARQMRAVFDGDLVLARIAGIDARNRREGAIVEVLERNTHQVVGRLSWANCYGRNYFSANGSQSTSWKNYRSVRSAHGTRYGN